MTSGFIREELVKAKNVLLHPITTFSDMAEMDVSLKDSLKYIAIIELIFLLFVIFSKLSHNTGYYFHTEGVFVNDLVRYLIISGFAFVYIFAYSFVASLIYYLLFLVPGRLMKMQFSYVKMYAITIYSITPYYLLGQYDILRIIAYIWSFVLFIIAYKELNKTSYSKTTLSMIFPLLVLILIGFALEMYQGTVKAGSGV